MISRQPFGRLLRASYLERGDCRNQQGRTEYDTVNRITHDSGRSFKRIGIEKRCRKGSRHFIRGSALPQQQTGSAIPMRPFGKTGINTSALAFGGHHLGDAASQQDATRLVSEAIDGGITFFDNCWEYHRGKTEIWMGEALKGKRDRVLLDDQSVHSWPRQGAATCEC